MNQSQKQELEQQAIDQAINGQWAQAIKTNLIILKKEPKDVPTLLRAGFASLQLGKSDDARAYYQKVLKLEKDHMIAKEYLDKISHQPKKKKKRAELNLDPNLFVELPGKTKSIQLMKIGQKKDLANIGTGQEVQLKIKRRHVEVRTVTGEYLGVLPDDIAVRMEYFLKQGSEYVSHVQESSLTNITIFVRELTKGKKVAKMTSFPVDASKGATSAYDAAKQLESDILEHTEEDGEDPEEDEEHDEEHDVLQDLAQEQYDGDKADNDAMDTHENEQEDGNHEED